MAMMVGLLLVTALVWQSTRAALDDRISYGGNTWQTGAVELTDNDNGVALFSGLGTNLTPGTWPAKCIEVTYTGDVPAEVRLYLARLDDHGEELDTLLTMKIDIGSGSSCASPGTWTQLSNSDLNTTARAAMTWATGLTPGAWKPSGTARETRPYRFTPTIADDNAAQGDWIRLDLVWEAHS
jgi:hypothetical protein